MHVMNHDVRCDDSTQIRHRVSGHSEASGKVLHALRPTSFGENARMATAAKKPAKKAAKKPAKKAAKKPAKKPAKKAAKKK